MPLLMLDRLQILLDTEGMTKTQAIRAELEIEHEVGAVSTAGGWRGTVRILHFDRWELETATKIGRRVRRALPQLKLMVHAGENAVTSP